MLNQQYLKYLVIPVIGFAVAYFLTPVIILMAKRIGMIDMPNARRMHKTPTPRGGGLAIFAGLHLACAAIFFLPWYSFEIKLDFSWWIKFLSVSSIVVAIGFIDDKYGMKAWVKLLLQTVTALLAFYMGIRFNTITYVHLSVYLDCILTVIWFLAFMNAFNLIDGLDGLACGLGAIAAAGMAGFFLLQRQPGDTLVMLGMIGACLGFLRYNFAPARIFLGDSGSMFLGFTLAAVSLGASAKNTILTAVGIPLLAAGVPFFDTLLAVWRRLIIGDNHSGINGQNGSRFKVFDVDLYHLHHRLARSGASHSRVALILYALNAGLVVLGLIGTAINSQTMVLYLLTFFAISLAVVGHLARVELWYSAAAIMQGIRRPARKEIAVVLYPLLDVLFLSVAAMLTIRLMWGDIGLGMLKTKWVDGMPYMVGIPFIVIMFSRTYRRVWSRVRLSELGLLSMSAFLGCLIGVSIICLLENITRRNMIMAGFTFCSLSLIPIVGLRILPRMIQDMFYMLSSYYTPDTIRKVPVLVYGAGDNYMLFLRQAFTEDLKNMTERRIIKALLDDDTNLHGRFVHGHLVIGGINLLEEAVKEKEIKEIILTLNIPEESKALIAKVAQKYGVKVLRWRAELVTEL